MPGVRRLEFVFEGGSIRKCGSIQVSIEGPVVKDARAQSIVYRVLFSTFFVAKQLLRVLLSLYRANRAHECDAPDN